MTIVIVVTLTGCTGSDKPAGFPKLYPVSVKVIQDGAPLAGASVQLTSSAFYWVAAGTTDNSGVAVLWTDGKYKGAPAGHFQVTVEKNINEGEEEYIAALNRYDSEAAAKIVVRSFSYVDEKFVTTATSPLTADIDSRTKQIEIDVSPAVKKERPYMK